MPSSVQTTRRYLGLEREYVQRTLARCRPRDRTRVLVGRKALLITRDLVDLARSPRSLSRNT